MMTLVWNRAGVRGRKCGIGARRALARRAPILALESEYECFDTISDMHCTNYFVLLVLGVLRFNRSTPGRAPIDDMPNKALEKLRGHAMDAPRLSLSSARDVQSTRILGLLRAYAIRCCTCMNGMHAVPLLLHLAFRRRKFSDEEKEL